MFQETGELGVPEGHMAFCLRIAERFDAVAERQQRFVDVGALVKSSAFVVGVGCAFRASQINDAESG